MKVIHFETFTGNGHIKRKTSLPRQRPIKQLIKDQNTVTVLPIVQSMFSN